MSRAKTGLVRPYPLPVGLSLDEDELLTLLSIKTKRSKADLLRRGFFKKRWQETLIELRSERLAQNKKK